MWARLVRPAFEYLRDRIRDLLQGYKIKMLSKKGKEILIKMVAQAILAYAMACFDLTKSLCESISHMICHFCWDNQEMSINITRLAGRR